MTIKEPVAARRHKKVGLLFLDDPVLLARHHTFLLGMLRWPAALLLYWY